MPSSAKEREASKADDEQNLREIYCTYRYQRYFGRQTIQRFSTLLRIIPDNVTNDVATARNDRLLVYMIIFQREIVEENM